MFPDTNTFTGRVNVVHTQSGGGLGDWPSHPGFGETGHGEMGETGHDSEQEYSLILFPLESMNVNRRRNKGVVLDYGPRKAVSHC